MPLKDECLPSQYLTGNSTLAIETMALRVLVTLVLYMSRVNCFLSNHVLSPMGSTSTSLTHKQITENAVLAMAKIFMDDYPSVYPDKAKEISTLNFKEAIQEFVDGAVKPGVEDHLMGLAEAHFDDEQITASNQRLLAERIKVIILHEHAFD